MKFFFLKALIGIAYSVGFIIGPVIGAIFSKHSQTTSGTLYILPAMFTVIVTVVDILFLTFSLEETLPKEKRVKYYLFKREKYA